MSDRQSREATASKMRRVLVVDSHASSRIAMCFALRSHGYLCMHVADEWQALHAIVVFRPDAILFDLPSEAARSLRLAAQRASLLPLLICVSVTEPPEAQWIAQGIDLQLCKPVDVLTLDRFLRDQHRGGLQ